MAGFLDKKRRILDYKLTENGRMQMSSGDIRFKYYTFSDRSIFYEEDTLKAGKVSNSDFYYLPFEVTQDPGGTLNPEYYLSSVLTYDKPEDSFFSIKTAQQTLVESLLSKQQLSTKELTNASEQTLNSFVFDFLDVTSVFDFLNETNTRKYPTVKFLKENIVNTKKVREDPRFKEVLKFKKLIPKNIDNSDIIQDNEALMQNNPLEFIFKSLDVKNNILNSDSRDEAIVKALRAVEKNKNSYFHKLEYNVNLSTIKTSDLIHFEMHEVKNNALTKLPFVKVGKFYDSSKNKFIEVFLIGKFILNNINEENFSIENRTLDRNLISNYHFINLFTLVLE